MRTINFSDARRQFKEVLDRVVDEADITIITRRDADDVVLMSLSEYNSWKETEYLLASPANARHLRESLAQLNAGQVVYHDLIEPEAPLRVQEPRAEYKVNRKKPKARRGKKRG
ncbi:MAG TPA: type II toxin-antitoxin system prevent-host-death family antitoxin [Rhodanobacteraceae bacterium]|nr:type II toxin-antitoxin system prevent-host-death family antitoxin [Rhodanobacteraceae bacterium]